MADRSLHRQHPTGKESPPRRGPLLTASGVSIVQLPNLMRWDDERGMYVSDDGRQRASARAAAFEYRTCECGEPAHPMTCCHGHQILVLPYGGFRWDPNTGLYVDAKGQSMTAPQAQRIEEYAAGRELLPTTEELERAAQAVAS